MTTLRPPTRMCRRSYARAPPRPACVRPGRCARARRWAGLPVSRWGRANVMAGVLVPSRVVELVAGPRAQSSWSEAQSSSPLSSCPELMTAPLSKVVAVELVARAHGQATVEREVRDAAVGGGSHRARGRRSWPAAAGREVKEGEVRKRGMGERSKRSHAGQRAHGRER
nr:unnamed protein product [Digitaria exilis]